MTKQTPTERRPRTLGPFIAVVLTLLAVTATPPAGADVCSRGNVPAATLLVPYFEVDLAAPGGKTTLFSIGNSAPTPTLAKVNVWTDWGVPAFGFFIHLGPDAVQTINLRDVVGRLQVPSLAGADAEDFPGCSAPQPPVAEPTVENVQARLTGRPNARNICHGSPRGDTTIAVGFVTVDVVRDCDLLVGGATPNDIEYVDLALDDNVLFGDIFYVDPDGDSAQGIAAVAVRSGRDPNLADHFYLTGVDRVPPDRRWRMRFLSGGAVAAETEVVIWSGSFLVPVVEDGVECGYDFGRYLSYVANSGPETGPLPDPLFPPFGFPYVPAPAMTRKLPLRELVSGAPPKAGLLDVEVWAGCPTCPFIPELGGRRPSVVFPLFRASGRFSVAVEATPIEGLCEDGPKRSPDV